MVEMVVNCENCEKWFCSDCDDESRACSQCGRRYCGACKAVVCCPPKEDE